MASSDSFYIASVVATYWCVSISMVYLNKVGTKWHGGKIVVLNE